MSNSDVSKATYSIIQMRDGLLQETPDFLAVEEPLEIRLGFTDPRKGRSHKSVSITMRTPGQDQDLALGFLYSESIISSAADIISVDTSKANVIRIELAENTRFDPLRLERHFYTTSSCGVCGKASLETLSLAGQHPVIDDNFSIAASALMQLPAKLSAFQPLFSVTGGNHGVALFNNNGEILAGAEDVGRHNALDKLIGRQLQQSQLPLTSKGILVSGRASFELMQKALTAGCPLLAAVGAPSSLAVELAQEFNITLIGFLGAHRFNLYHGRDRLRFDNQPQTPRM